MNGFKGRNQHLELNLEMMVASIAVLRWLRCFHLLALNSHLAVAV